VSPNLPPLIFPLRSSQRITPRAAPPLGGWGGSLFLQAGRARGSLTRTGQEASAGLSAAPGGPSAARPVRGGARARGRLSTPSRLSRLSLRHHPGKASSTGSVEPLPCPREASRGSWTGRRGLGPVLDVLGLPGAGAGAAAELGPGGALEVGGREGAAPPRGPGVGASSGAGRVAGPSGDVERLQGARGGAGAGVRARRARRGGSEANRKQTPSKARRGPPRLAANRRGPSLRGRHGGRGREHPPEREQNTPSPSCSVTRRHARSRGDRRPSRCVTHSLDVR
jgi:hypothetical protein